jgi:hypothetical protein
MSDKPEKPQQATGERPQTGRTKEKLRENTGLLVAALEKHYSISIDFDFQQMIYSALSWTADDVAEQLAQQSTDGALRAAKEEAVLAITKLRTTKLTGEQFYRAVSAIVERALAAQASSDPAIPRSYRAVGGDRIRELVAKWRAVKCNSDKHYDGGKCPTCRDYERRAAELEAVLAAKGEVVEDGFGSIWVKACPVKGCKGEMQVMRPGKVQCSQEHAHEKLRALAAQASSQKASDGGDPPDHPSSVLTK